VGEKGAFYGKWTGKKRGKNTIKGDGEGGRERKGSSSLARGGENKDNRVTPW